MYIGAWQELRLGQLLSEHQRLLEQAATQQVQLLQAQQQIAQLTLQQTTAAAAAPPLLHPIHSPTRTQSTQFISRTLPTPLHARPRRSRPESATLPPLFSPLASPQSTSHARTLPLSSTKSTKSHGRHAQREVAAIERAQHIQRMRALYNLDPHSARKAEEERKEPETQPTLPPATIRVRTPVHLKMTADAEVEGSARRGEGFNLPPSAGSPARWPTNPAFPAFPSPVRQSSLSPPSPVRPMSAEAEDFLRHMDVEVQHQHAHISAPHPPEVDPSESEWATINDIRIRPRATDPPSSSSSSSLLPDPVDVTHLPPHQFPAHLSHTYQHASDVATSLTLRRTRQRKELQLIDDVFDALHSEALPSAKRSLCRTLLMHLREEEEGNGAGSWQASVDLLEHWHAVLVEAAEGGSDGVGSVRRLLKAEGRLEEALRLREEELRTGVEATAEQLRRVREDKTGLEWMMQQSLLLRPGASTQTPRSPLTHSTSSPRQDTTSTSTDSTLPPLKSRTSSITSSTPSSSSSSTVGRLSLTLSSPSPSSSALTSGQHSASQSPPSLSIFRSMQRGAGGSGDGEWAGRGARLEPIQVKRGVGGVGDEVSSASLRMEEEVEDVMRFVDGVSEVDSD